MPDLRARLREIETAPPPDLWEGIEARAKEEGPMMDRDIASLDVFRSRAAERRRRLTAGLVAAAVVAALAVFAWQEFRDRTLIAPAPTGALPDGWVRCTNEPLGYSIGFPGAWHTTDVFDGQADAANACMWFQPAPFGPQGNGVLEGWGFPLEVATGASFDQELLQVTDPEAARVLEREDLFVEGHRAVRIEYETLVDLIADTGRHYQYVIELDPDMTLIVHTTETRGIEGDYDQNKTVVDNAVDTLRFTSG